MGAFENRTGKRVREKVDSASHFLLMVVRQSSEEVNELKSGMLPVSIDVGNSLSLINFSVLKALLFILFSIYCLNCFSKIAVFNAKVSSVRW